MIIGYRNLFAIMFMLVMTPVLLPKIVWLAHSQTTLGSMRFAGKNYSGQIVHTYSVIRFYAGGDTIWFNSGDNVIFNEGATVPVRYERDRPSDARVDIFTEIWGDTIIYGGVPLLILLMIFLHPKGVSRNIKVLLSYNKPYIRFL